MGVTIAEETLLFLKACLLGVGMGILYDVVRIFRIAVKCPKFIVFIQDLAYFIFLTVVSFSFLIACNDGRLRVFIIIGEIMGAVAYFFSVSIVLLKLAKALIALVKKILFVLYRILLFPFVWLFCQIGKLIKKLLRVPLTKIKNIMVKMRNCLKNRVGLVYNTIKKKCTPSIKKRGKSSQTSDHTEAFE